MELILTAFKQIVVHFKNRVETVRWVIMEELHQLHRLQFLQGGANYVCWLVGAPWLLPALVVIGRQVFDLKRERGTEEKSTFWDNSTNMFVLVLMP